MYEVRLSRRAWNYYRRQTPDMIARLERCFEGLSRNPFQGGDIRPVKGRRGLFRYRVGDLRVMYEVDIREKLVKVFAILPRGEAY